MGLLDLWLQGAKGGGGVGTLNEWIGERSLIVYLTSILLAEICSSRESERWRSLSIFLRIAEFSASIISTRLASRSFSSRRSECMQVEEKIIDGRWLRSLAQLFKFPASRMFSRFSFVESISRWALISRTIHNSPSKFNSYFSAMFATADTDEWWISTSITFNPIYSEETNTRQIIQRILSNSNSFPIRDQGVRGGGGGKERESHPRS